MIDEYGIDDDNDKWNTLFFNWSPKKQRSIFPSMHAYMCMCEDMNA